jgi:hypothetical protein
MKRRCRGEEAGRPLPHSAQTRIPRRLRLACDDARMPFPRRRQLCCHAVRGRQISIPTRARPAISAGEVRWHLPSVLMGMALLHVTG